MKIFNSSFIISSVYLLVFLQFQSVAQTADYEMLVSSRNTHSIKRFNAQTGEYKDDYISPGSGGLSTPQDVIEKPDGNILVSGRGNTSILEYDKTSGAFIKPFTTGYSLDNPTKIAFGPDGNLYVSQWGTSNQKIARFNGTSGQYIGEFTPSMSLPLGQTWDAEGNLYVACYGSGQVKKFDTAGNFSGIFTETGHLHGPTNLWFDKNGNLFVIDWDLGSVFQFNALTGAFIRIFVTGLVNAEGYAFGPDSNLYICDWTRNQVRNYTLQGVFISIFTNQGNMVAPNSILFRQGNVISEGEVSNLIADNYYLEQNYPNPFNPITKIIYEIPDSRGKRFTNYVTLKVYNILGNEVKTLVNNYQNAGRYSVEFDGSNLSGGIYFYRIEANDFIQTKKMILIK